MSSGFATPSDLARLSLAASDAGAPIVGVVIANSDPGDYSLGIAAVYAGLDELTAFRVSRSAAGKSAAGATRNA